MAVSERRGEEPEFVEAELVRPVERRSRAADAVDAVLETTGRVVLPVARLGWHGVRRVGRGLGLDQAVGRAVDRGLDRALRSDVAERAVDRALEADSVKRAWRRVLESDEAQLLVERVAEAPEVRSAITSQGVGLLEDVRRSARRAARRIDDGAEAAARRLLGRAQRTGRPPYAGVATRGLALALDGALLSGILLLASTMLALLFSAVFSIEGDSKTVTIAFGALAWWVAAALYLAGFWTLAERTPGMTFLGIRVLDESGGRVPPRQDLRRLVGFVLALLPAGLGFAGVLLDERRRGWHDRFARTLVLYADPEIDPGVDRLGRVSVPR
jgi:uncharacterized RDD family membrane protein YckC